MGWIRFHPGRAKLGTRFIGRYKVIEEIGRGGMGIVYRGEDPRLERPVAIKVLPPRKTAKAQERFKREARVCARLDHPYILKIFDYGEEEETYHLVMEYVEGITLREFIGDEPELAKIDIPEMARLFGQICLALDYAHALQITHRDIKPENIMVTTTMGPWGVDRRVKVMDFGLAVLGDRHDLTAHDAVMGTIAYFAPEQARGERVDHRADIYAMGAVFFEMLTGRLPFEATNPSEMIKHHLETPAPSPRTLNPAVPPVLERIVLVCMRKDPADRYQAVRAIREELETYRSQAGISAVHFWGSTGIVVSAEPVPLPVPEASLPEEPRRGFSQTQISLDAPDAGPASLDVSPLASPMTPGMPPDLARRLGPSVSSTGLTPRAPAASGPPPVRGPMAELATREEEAASSSRAPSTKEPPARPGSRSAAPAPPAAPERPMVPTAGGTPVASREWMQEASDEGPWNRYQNFLARLRKDDESSARGADVPSTLCGNCGIENPGDRKYCHECGSLLAPSEVQIAREAAAHNEMGARLLRQGNLQDAVYEFQQALLRDEKYGEAHRNLGKAWVRAGDLVKGEEELRLAASLIPEDAETHLELGALYRAAGRKTEAIGQFEECLRCRPDDTSVRCQLAFLHAHRGNLVKAVEEYRTVIAYDQQNLEAHLQLGIIFGSQNLVAEAIQEFEWVVRLDSSNASAWHWLGRLHQKRNRFSDAERAFQNALAIEPSDAEIHADLGSLYEVQRKEDLALRELRQAIALDQGSVEARTRLASLYLRHNQPAKAIQELEEVAAFHPRDARLHQQLGDLYLNLNQIDRALEHYEQTVSLDPGSAEMHNRLGQLYLKKDYDGLSIQEYQKAVSIDPYNPSYHEDLGMAYYVNGRRDIAVQEIKKAAILDSRNVDYVKALGILCEEEGRLDEAVQALKRTLELVPRDADAHGLLGRIYARQGLLNWAILEFQKALEYSPENRLMNIYLARSYAELGKPDMAVAYFKKAIALMKGQGETPEGRRALARSYTDLARAYLEADDLRSAQEVLETALSLMPEDARALHAMGLVQKGLGNAKKALEYLSGALQREPQNAELLADLGHLYQDRGDFELALKAYRKAISLHPARPRFYELLGTLMQVQHKLDEAVEAYRKAASFAPRQRARYHALLGGVFLEQGRWQRAINEFQQVQAEDETDLRAYEGLARAYQELGRNDEALAELESALDKVSMAEADARRLRQQCDRLRSPRR